MAYQRQYFEPNKPLRAQQLNLMDEELERLGHDKLDANRHKEIVEETLELAMKQGLKGDPGYTPVRYKDYWTKEDQEAITEEVSNQLSLEIADELAKRGQLKPEFANSTADCTDATKLYVLPDGFIYAYISAAPEITIETKQGGYYNSNGAWVADSSATGQRTNLIPVKPGDQFEVTSMGKWQASVIWFTSAETKISHSAYGPNTSTPETVTVTAPANAAYVRFYSYGYSAAYLAVTPLTVSYAWVSTGHAFVPADYEDRIVSLEKKTAALEAGVEDVLKGKKIVYDGDSIAESRTSSGSGGNGGAYAKIIADMTGGTYANHAVGGAYLRTTTTGKHSVVDNLANLPEDGDLYCFEGGINDFWNGAVLGEYSESDYTSAVDATTVCGALETIFRYALNNFLGKPICFVIVHKVQNTAHANNSAGNTFSQYREKMIGICKKYSIPYYDAYADSGLNGWNSAQNNAFLTSNSTGTADGCHPNAEGYKRYYVPQLLSLFRKIMPC